VKLSICWPLFQADLDATQGALAAIEAEELSVAMPKSAAKPKPQTTTLRLAARGFKNCVNIQF
jgi:hypothetical protein